MKKFLVVVGLIALLGLGAVQHDLASGEDPGRGGIGYVSADPGDADVG